ncbi:MAG: K(+)-transporting ATPase subunit C [Actinomycetia bacterium]|nr:K(+)-transporting ATPase subunit C [Actinomycetes bacterium]
MSVHLGGSLRTVWTAVRAMVVLTVILGILYPLVVLAIGRVAFPSQAGGSLIRNANGQVVGSSLIGQSFSDADGNPLPQYFQPRPSVAGDGYDATSSGASNLGPESNALFAAIEERKAAIAEFNGVAVADVPPDAVTASGSGLDPDISVAYATIQIDRVARVRNLSPDVVSSLVSQYTRGRDLGYIGEPRVNVVELNLALDEYHG